MKKCLISMAVVFFTAAATHCAFAASPAVPSGITKGNMRIVNLVVSKTNIAPDPVVVNSGEMVYLLVTSAKEDCKLVVPAFKIDQAISADKMVPVSFVSRKAGAFKFYCAFGRVNVKARIVVLKVERKSQ